MINGYLLTLMIIQGIGLIITVFGVAKGVKKFSDFIALIIGIILVWWLLWMAGIGALI